MSSPEFSTSAAAVAPAAAEVAEPTLGWRYYAVVPVLYASFMALGAVLVAPYLVPGLALNSASLSQWDVEHYLIIKNQGYDLQRTAFFPAFPYFWRWLQLSAAGISGVNLVVFVATFMALAKEWKLTRPQQLLALSVPSLLFMAVPYSEALFFLGGTLALLGWRREQEGLAWLGILLCSVTRSAAFVFVPALLLAGWLTRRELAAPWRRLGGSCVAALGGLAFSVYVHYRATGVWLAFSQAQQQFWDNHLQWPKWPLENWGGPAVTRYEAVAMAAAVACLLYLYKAWRQAPQKAPAFGVAFSALYLVGVTVLTLATKGGWLASLSRYTFATPFFLVMLVEGRNQRLSTRQLLWLVLGAELVWLLLFRSFGHIHTLLMYVLLGAYGAVLLANLHINAKVQKAALWLSVSGNSALMIWLLFRFLTGEWAG
ncbi:hypothetical protein HER32_08950 [Hymenobacter sp. BT18]|uniref:hypothetical protein n=1 Tax=Hymenobacter sp. BT18 TaxID=2835648 RepID=UPI00143E4270|nr:hypothetical protein [Hymenobacter sp. BT18]QIX61301.1 hypothetical protein HER32_08950 [Hymenobacter sp. BT18]